jgi:hypothetical protein
VELYFKQNPVTCECIWHRIVQKAYDTPEFEELERIYPELYFSAWKDLMCIKEVPKLKVYHGKMGKIQRLFLVFLIKRIDPYRELYWTADHYERKDYLECTVSPHSEMLTQFGHELFRTRERGVFRFDVCIEESLICLEEGRFIKAVYRDHTYTVIHFQEECQKIHLWFNVLGLTENDYKIDRPRRKRHDNLTGADGTIRVEVELDNWEYAPHI